MENEPVLFTVLPQTYGQSPIFVLERSMSMAGMYGGGGVDGVTIQ